ncbi:MAG: hypothetical protein AAFP09_12100 [Cyanobacteria bacterium J06607_10]
MRKLVAGDDEFALRKVFLNELERGRAACYGRKSYGFRLPLPLLRINYHWCIFRKRKHGNF